MQLGMDAFKEHVRSGEKIDIAEAVVLRKLTDRIVVYNDRLEIHLRIGGTLEQKYLEVANTGKNYTLSMV